MIILRVQAQKIKTGFVKKKKTILGQSQMVQYNDFFVLWFPQ